MSLARNLTIAGIGLASFVGCGDKLKVEERKLYVPRKEITPIRQREEDSKPTLYLCDEDVEEENYSFEGEQFFTPVVWMGRIPNFSTENRYNFESASGNEISEPFDWNGNGKYCVGIALALSAVGLGVRDVLRARNRRKNEEFFASMSDVHNSKVFDYDY